MKFPIELRVELCVALILLIAPLPVIQAKHTHTPDPVYLHPNANFKSSHFMILKTQNALLWQSGNTYYSTVGESLLVTAWGQDSVRVQASPYIIDPSASAALLPLQVFSSSKHRKSHSTSTDPFINSFNSDYVKILIHSHSSPSSSPGGTLINGNIRVDISGDGSLTVTRVNDGVILYSDFQNPAGHGHAARRWEKTQRISTCSQCFRASLYGTAYDDERIFGMGQHSHGRLNQKGLEIELVQMNTKVTIPFAVSSRGYGFLWNTPAYGAVIFGYEYTRWTTEAGKAIDFWITTSTPASKSPYADIMKNYADATGHPSALPSFASGFWQSKDRYRNQSEILAVAEGYVSRGLPISVIVIDWFHWIHLGDWKFNPACWPDPASMVTELKGMNITTMVSVWPKLDTDSINFPNMSSEGLLAGTVIGNGDTSNIYDPFNPAARKYIWDHVKTGYYDYGIKMYWLDACEPEISQNQFDSNTITYSSGTHIEIGNAFPTFHQRAMWEGMKSLNETEIITLSRSAWAGSQRFGAAVWSGDSNSDFEFLKLEIPAGQNMMMSGIPWWTTDIGGYFNGDINDPVFQELIVRWFQFGAFCPIFRLHGHREPEAPNDPVCGGSGGDNEIWHFGDKAFTIISAIIKLRESLRPYVMSLMQEATDSGTPPMRPLFFEFPFDSLALTIEDQFMFGSDFLVAPVTEYQATQRNVYFPGDNSVIWTDFFSQQQVSGGQTVAYNVTLSTFPLFVRGPTERTELLLGLRAMMS